MRERIRIQMENGFAEALTREPIRIRMALGYVAASMPVHIKIQTGHGYAGALMPGLTKIRTAPGFVVVPTLAHIRILMANGSAHDHSRGVAPPRGEVGNQEC